MLRVLLALSLTSSLAFAAGCKSSADGTPPDDGAGAEEGAADKGAGEQAGPVVVDEIVYHFQDASVPPEHHRSVTITVTRENLLRIVDSYGDEVSRDLRPLTPERFDALVAAYEKAGLEKKKAGKDLAGCTGGTGESLRVSNQGVELFSGSVEHCGGKDAPDFSGDFESVVSAIKAQADAPE